MATMMDAIRTVQTETGMDELVYEWRLALSRGELDMSRAQLACAERLVSAYNTAEGAYLDSGGSLDEESRKDACWTTAQAVVAFISPFVNSPMR